MRTNAVYLFNTMSAFYTLVSLALLCQTIMACDESKNTVVNVDVYYESLCPDSIDFINNQLVPNYGTFKDHLKLNLIPFGKAMYKKGENGDRYQFMCQHGTSECAGNRAQSCAIQVINQDTSLSKKDRQAKTVKFVGCAMSRSRVNSIEPCANAAGLNENKTAEIVACSESLMGDQLLAKNGDKTTNLIPKLTFVPTIVVNENYIKENQLRSLSNFRQMMCDLLTDDCDMVDIC